MNLCNIKKTFEDYKSKGWDRIFILIDVHGTIIPNGKHDAFSFITKDAEEVLRWFSNRPEIRLILWSSSYAKELHDIQLWLYSIGINFEYLNQNPEVTNTERACFDQKLYYNILIEDRAGFEPLQDWAAMKKELMDIGEWR